MESIITNNKLEFIKKTSLYIEQISAQKASVACIMGDKIFI